MKHMRKIMALAIAMVMMLSMSMSVFAEETQNTVKIANSSKDTATHKYDAYQIFAGSTKEDTNIESVTWGTATTGKEASFITAIQAAFSAEGNAISKLTADSTAGVVAGAIGEVVGSGTDTENGKKLAETIAKWVTDNNATKAVAGGASTGFDVDDGYYFIQDADEHEDTEYTAVTRYILEVVEDVDITAKSDVPSVTKDVDDENDSSDSEDSVEWKKTADYDIGDVIPYKLVGTLPTNFNEYEWYSYKFTDTMTNLSYVDGSAHVYACGYNPQAYQMGVEEVVWVDVTDEFTITGNGGSLVVEAKGAKGLQTQNVYGFGALEGTGEGIQTPDGAYVDSLDTYTVAEINELPTQAVGGVLLDPTISKIVVRYDATLESTAVIGNDGNPNTVDLEFSNNPNKGGEGDKGKTPQETNVVFTYKLDVDKLDENYEDLAGAAFTLLKKYAELPEDATATAYTEDAVKAAAKDAWLSETTGTGDAAVTSYWKVVDALPAGDTTTSFEFKGIDDGDYRLVETVVPTGYNKNEDLNFTVTGTHDDTTKKITALSAGDSFQTSVNGGSFEFKKDDDHKHTMTATTGQIGGVVINQSGTTLPETGGIGTTIFYIIGAILVIGAGVVLVTRRRMSAN